MLTFTSLGSETPTAPVNVAVDANGVSALDALGELGLGA